MVISTLIWKNIVFQKQKFKSCLCLPRHSMDHQWIGLDSLVVHSSKITSHSSSLNNLPIPSTTPLISDSKALAINDLYNHGIGFGIYNHASSLFMIQPILPLQGSNICRTRNFEVGQEEDCICHLNSCLTHSRLKTASQHSHG